MLVFALPLLLLTASVQTAPEEIPTTQGAFQRLSAPPSTLGLEGDVQDFLLHPGGGAVLFRADTRWPGSFGLYHVPVAGGVPGVVYEPVQGRSVSSYALDPSGRWVAFVADRDHRGVFELYSHRVGTPGVRRLTPAPIPGAEVKSFAFSPDGGLLVYLADHEVDGKFELFTVPSDGSAPPRRLGGSRGIVMQYRFDGSGSRILFVDREPTRDRIVSVTRAGSVTEHRSAPGFGDVRFTADGQSAFYREPGPFGTELFRLELDGIATPKRMSPLASQSRQGVGRFIPTPDGNRVVFLADLDEFGRSELWSADRNGLATQLAPAPDLGTLVDLLVSPDSNSAVSWVDAFGVTTTVFAVPTDGSALPRVLARPNHFRSDQHQLSADSRYLVYRTGLRVGLPSEGALWSVRLDGTAPARRLDDPRGRAWPDYTPSKGSLTIDPGSTRVLYTWKAPEEFTAGLYSAPLDGSEPQAMVRQRGASFDFDFSLDGARAVFTASVGGVEVFELHSTRLSDLATTRLSADLAPGLVDDVQSFFQADPSGQHLVYASTANGASARLYRTRADGSEPAIALAATDARGPFTLSPDATRVVYTDTAGALCSVRADGTGSKLVLAAASVSGYSRFTPDSTRFLYTDALGLRSVPSAGGSVLLLADEPPASPLLVTPDSARVVFLATPAGGSQRILSVPVDGAGASHVLYAAGQLSVADPVLVASGTHVLFGSYTYNPDRTSILCAPVDGSAPALDLTAPFHEAAVLPDFSGQSLVPDGQHFVYSALTDNGWGLFKRRIDGVGTPLLLFDGAESPFQFVFTPDARRVVFSSFVGEPRLWSAPLDGTTGAFELSSAATPSVAWFDPVLSPDGRFVLSLARIGGQDRLLAARLDGASVLQPIDGQPAGVNVREFLIAPDSASVVFRVEGAAFQLHQRVLDEEGPVLPVAGSGGARVVTLVRIEQDSSGLSLWGTRLIGVNELFRARLERAPFLPRLRRR